MPESFRLGDWVVEPSADRLVKNGHVVRLRTKVMNLLVFLAEHPGEVLSKEQILQGVWKTEFVSESALTSGVTELRHALGDDVERPVVLETIPKRGYRLLLPVVKSAAPLHARATRVARDSRRFVATGLSGAIAIVIITAGVLRWSRPGSPSSPGIVRTLIDVRPARYLMTTTNVFPEWPSRTVFALSDDGRTLVFTGGDTLSKPFLFVRRLENDAATRLNEDRAAEGLALSPDGRSLVFWTPLAGQISEGRRAGELRRILIDGGASELVVRVAHPTGLHWSADGWIYFGRVLGGISRVPATGGEVEPVTQLQGDEWTHRLPHVLPGGRALLYTVATKKAGILGSHVAVKALHGGSPRVLFQGADARYLPAGYVAFVRLGKLLVVPFDPGNLVARGDPVVVADVMQAINTHNPDADSGAAQMSVSATGSLAYLRGEAFPDLQAEVVWVDRKGRSRPLGIPVRPFVSARSSSDGKYLVMEEVGHAYHGVWLQEVERGTMVRVPGISEPTHSPLWAPQSTRYVVAAPSGIYLADRVTGRLSRIFTATPDRPVPSPVSWSPAGRSIFAVDRGDIVEVSVEGVAGEVKPLVATPAHESFPEISPDGRWLAHTTDASGVTQVVVRPYPALEPVRQISVDGGSSPCWRRDGREIFFRSPRGAATPRHLMSVEIHTGGPQPRFGHPRALFDVSGYENTFPHRSYDVSVDGMRFLMVKRRPRVPTPPPSQINLVFNWFEELKQKAPARN